MKLALHWQILIGMLLGVVFGLIAANLGWDGFISDWIKPFGTIFINMLKLIAIPLIIASLITGVANLGDLSDLSTMGGRTVGLYLISTVLAVTIGLITVNVVAPGKLISEETREEIVSAYATEATSRSEKAAVQKEAGPLQALVDVVPNNIVSAAASNRNMLQVIFFVLFFGVGLLLIDKEKAAPVKAFFDGLNDVILKLVDLIMLAAPFGVFALLAALVVESPSADLFYALLGYAGCVVLGLGLMIFVIYPLVVRALTGIGYGQFFNGMGPAQLLAFSTSSSAATLPLTMERVTEHIGVKEEVSSFVLPIGATINMDGTSLYQAVAAVFIAQAFGLEPRIGMTTTPKSHNTG